MISRISGQFRAGPWNDETLSAKSRMKRKTRKHDPVGKDVIEREDKRNADCH